MRVLVIGGSGEVGAIVLPTLAAHHEIKVFDLRRSENLGGAKLIVGDVFDSDSLNTACQQADAVVFMAMGSKEDWGSASWARSQFNINVAALFAALQAAITAGVPKLIHTSSMSIFGDWLHVSATSTPDATDAYGLSKRLGEQVCLAATTEANIDVTALRLVLPVSDSEWHTTDDRLRSVMTAGSDVARAYLLALSTHLPGFRTVTISGDHAKRQVDWSDAQLLLGWEPEARRADEGQEAPSSVSCEGTTT